MMLVRRQIVLARQVKRAQDRFNELAVLEWNVRRRLEDMPARKEETDMTKETTVTKADVEAREAGELAGYLARGLSRCAYVVVPSGKAEAKAIEAALCQAAETIAIALVRALADAREITTGGEAGIGRDVLTKELMVVFESAFQETMV
jgi:hypothetical protein